MVKETKLLTAKEAAKFLNVSESTLRKMKIKPYRVGKRRRYTYEMLEEYLEGSKKAPSGGVS